jgi:drug/metabolite transporter (DMT)-like permease
LDKFVSRRAQIISTLKRTQENPGSLGSIQYILSMLAAHFFLQEKIDTTKLIGTSLITLGIILTAAS